MKAVLLSSLALGAGSGVACSSDSSPNEGDTPVDDAGAGPGGGTSAAPGTDGGPSYFEFFGIDDPKQTDTLYRDVPAPYEDAAGCKAYANAFPEVHACSCDKCFEIQQQCDAMEGCREIAQCGQEIGCSDAYTCYLIPSNPKCVPIIDKWGNTGLAAALSLKLGECTIAQGCRTVP